MQGAVSVTVAEDCTALCGQVGKEEASNLPERA